MKSELIDIQVIDYGDELEIALFGVLGASQLPAVREKIEMLTRGSVCFIFLNLERVRFTTNEYLLFFLELHNTIRGRNSSLILLFKDEKQTAFFSGYRNIFEIYASREAYRKSGLAKKLKQIGVYYGKKTGLRLSPSVAMAITLLTLGWAITLFLIIAAQGRDIADKQAQIIALQNQKDRYVREIDKLEASIGPMRKLGVVEDSTLLNSFGAIQDWVSYLEFLENTRREE